MSMFEDIPVDVGVIYEGERIRKAQMYVELGGPKVDKKFELVRARKMEEVEDGKITIIGPDIKDMEPGSRHPFGILVEVAGKEVEEELEGVIERRIHEFCNYIEGFMHLNQRYDIWLRLSKKSFEKGLNSFELIGKVLIRLFKAELPFIEKIQITFITDPDKVAELYDEALKVYEARDAKARGLKDEEVETFYGCTLCQSFAPTHVCVITAQRYSNCGAISWFDARAASRVDPKGPIFEIPKGECIDPVKGEYTVLERVKDFVPKELIDKIATEKDVSNVEELKEFLKAKGHPVVETWKEEVTAPPPAAEAPAAAPAEGAPAAAMPTVTLPGGVIGGAGIRLILKNAKVYAEKVIIKVVPEEKR